MLSTSSDVKISVGETDTNVGDDVENTDNFCVVVNVGDGIDFCVNNNDDTVYIQFQEIADSSVRVNTSNVIEELTRDNIFDVERSDMVNMTVSKEINITRNKANHDIINEQKRY